MQKQTLTKTLMICSIAILIIYQLAYAQINEFKITASDGAEYDWFGLSVSISGDYAIVGAQKDDDNGSSSGSAYVFKRTGTSWAEEAKLTASDAAADDDFGYSVSISGDYAIVGAVSDDDNGDGSGSAYVFKRTDTNWTQEAKLTASDGAEYDMFGYSVSISGDYAIVDAHRDDDNGSNSGSAYVFKRTDTSWAEEVKLTASDGAENDYFGHPVSISGDYVIVGAYKDDDNGGSSGSAYVFKRTDTSWTEEAKLTANDGASGDNFGKSVSISDDYVIVGAFADDDNGSGSGSAYVFKRTGTNWTQEAKLTASDGASGDNFGHSVSISGGYAIVGAYQDDDNGDGSGSAYVFKRTDTNWIEETKLTASDGAASDNFGGPVSISGDYAIVGAYMDDDNGSNSGSAYIYSGIIPAPLLSVSPLSIDFSYVLVEETTTKQLTVKNTGTADLNISSITITGVDSLIFSVDTSAFMLGPGDSLFLDINFTPDDTGSYSASLDIESYGGNASVTLAGNGFEIAGDYTLEFDGVDDYVNTGPIMNGVVDFTISAWIRTTQDTASSFRYYDPAIIGTRQDYMISQDIILTNYNGKLAWFDELGAGENTYDTGTNIADGIWHQVAVVRDGSALTFYIDGVSVGTDATGTNSVRDDDVEIGQAYLNGSEMEFNGQIDEVRIWDTARTQAQIQADMFSHLDGTEAGLVGYYRMDEGAGQTVIDYSGNENHGQLGSAAGVDDSDPGWTETDWPYTPAKLSVSPLSINFSYVLIGETTTKQLAVKNTGIADLNVSSIAVSGIDSLNFNISTTPFTLVPSDSLFFDISFTPDDTGSFNALLDFISDGGSASVELTGNGFEIAGDYALEFDGVDDYVDCGNNESLDITEAITISAWIKANEDINGYVICKKDFNYYGMVIGDDTDRFQVNLNNVHFIAPYNYWGEWKHIAFTYAITEGIVKQYIDGVIENEEDFTQPINVTTGNLQIGRRLPSIYYFDGNIDEVRIWNYARTQEEIQADMSHLLDGDEEGLAGYWRMDEGNGQTLVDWSVNGNDGQLGSTVGVDSKDPTWLESYWPYGSPVLSVSLDSIDFGDVIIEETATELVTVSNTGNADLTVLYIAFTGDAPENFNLAMVPYTTIPFTLEPGTSQMLEVSFTPDYVDSLSAILEIDSDGGDADIALFGNGIAFPVLSVTPLTIDFGAIPEGDTATEQVTVANTGTADLNVSLIAITGADSSKFDVDTTTFTLAPDDSQILAVSFSPDGVGSFSAVLEIESDSGSVSVTLDGVGVDPIPLIISITDVPEDQGGWVFLDWISSGYDSLGEITQYGIWELNPDDEWVSLGNVPAIQDDEYIYLAHTFADSTDEGIFWSKFMVTAHTADPELFFESAVDSGYSVDNLAPAVPTGLLALATTENAVDLSWDSPIDEDFNYFKIYRSLTPDFDPTGMESFAETIETTFIDSDVEIGITYYYILSAIDFNGNESEYSDVVDATVLSIDDEIGIPTKFALLQNYPNPFNPITTIQYELPQRSNVQIIICNLVGRKMATLLSEIQDAGYKSVQWDATNVSSGVYFYQIRAGGFVQTRKMILLK